MRQNIARRYQFPPAIQRMVLGMIILMALQSETAWGDRYLAGRFLATGQYLQSTNNKV